MLDRAALAFLAAACGACATTEREAAVALAAAELDGMKREVSVGRESVALAAGVEGTPAAPDADAFVLRTSTGESCGWALHHPDSDDAARLLAEDPDAPRIMIDLVLSISLRARH